VLQSIARENAVSETAFFTPRVSSPDDFDLRWMTPTIEVDLCGHATLAAAFVLMTVLDPTRTRVRFHTVSGMLEVEREGDTFTLDLPSRPPDSDSECAVSVDALGAALGTKPAQVLGRRFMLALYTTAEEIRALIPCFTHIAELETPVVLVTAPGTGADGDVDFVSRFFAPREGIPEDPVTGSAHATLTPYWAARLGKTTLSARQVSARSGELTCVLAGDRVRLAGHAVLVKKGVLLLPNAP
jgi:PhzF family phenazine biosynthesis protein